MNEEQYRAERVKQAKLQNLISMRFLAKDSAVFAQRVNVNDLDNQIKELSGI